MKLFKEMELPPVLLEAVDALGYTEPTPIQAQAIPAALTGQDIFGSAQTGTGKTMAFSIPLAAHLLQRKDDTALILAPTRELACQIEKAIKQLLQKQRSSFKTALLIGGDPIVRQLAQLKSGANVIVGTPGRVIDHIEQGTLKTQNITFLVLDEADRMFDMGFDVQIHTIINALPTQRQTLMFSATFPPKVERLADKYMKQPVRIALNDAVAPAQNLKQETIQVTEAEKYDALLVQLDRRKGSIIVFVKTKFGAQKLAQNLCKEKHQASALHGNLQQNKRKRVMAEFAEGRYRIMVATDIAARGLDVPSVEHVINYNLPCSPEDYIHRIGRTARAGAAGEALNLLSAQDLDKWDAIQRLMHPDKYPSKRTSSPQNSNNRNRRRRGNGGNFHRGGKGGNTGFGSRNGSRSSRGQGSSGNGNKNRWSSSTPAS